MKSIWDLNRRYCIMKSSTRQMISSSRKQVIWLAAIISFLLFFLNLLVILSYNTQVFWDNVREKLGVYLYLNDTDLSEDFVYAEAIDMKEELEDAWLDVEFYSKEDAFNVLEERLPNVIGNFEKYWIENPLPPTMYVQFSDEADYRRLKDAVLKYEDIILNLNDISEEWFALSDQEHRSSQVINLTNFLTTFSYVLIWVIWIIIISFLLFGLQLTFYRFKKQVEVEKLLWAWYFRIKRCHELSQNITW